MYNNIDVMEQKSKTWPSQQPMTSEGFKRSWMREASEQPGMILEVLPGLVLSKLKKRV